MGRATITETGTAGDYTISADYGTATRSLRVANLQAQVAKLEAGITEVESRITSSSLALTSLESDFNVAITAYQSSGGENTKELQDATVALSAARNLVQKWQIRKRQYEAMKANTEARIADLQALALTESKEVWCVDYTLDGTGVVGTIEINAEQPQTLIVAGCEAPMDADGQVISRDLLTPEASYYNVALLPGWQKYRPTYRVGDLVAIDRENDLGTVDLDPASSSAQSLDINQEETLTDIPIEYMDCNSLAFDVYDRVVVKFDGQDWSSAKVIGFESEPKPCGFGIAREVFYRPFFGGNNEDWNIALPGDVAESLLAELRTCTETNDPPDDLVVEVRKPGDIWRTMNLGAVTTADEGGQGPATNPIQWRFDTTGVLPGGEDSFYLTFMDTTAEFYDWSSLDGSNRVYTGSYYHGVPLFANFSTPYDLDWVSESYEFRVKKFSTGDKFLHWNFGRIGYAGPDIARMNGVAQIDAVPGVPPGTVRDMDMEFDRTLLLPD